MRWFAVSALVLLLQVPASATVLQEHSQRPYPVPIAPGQTLRQALQAATPIVVDGRRFHGYTRWNVRWNYRWWREASGRCAITEVTTRLTTEVQLPELRGATPQQQATLTATCARCRSMSRAMFKWVAMRPRPSTRALPAYRQPPIAPRWSATPTRWAAACSRSM